MRCLLCLALLLIGVIGCREQNTEPPSGHEIQPPRSAAKLAPEAGLAAPQANLMGTVADGVVTAPSGGVTQKLFADDVASDELALTIGIETIGDVATPLFPRGTKLPTTHTEVFSTALDDQNRVEVHVLQGERPLASQNRSLGKFQLFGIPPAPRGVPQIEVTFAIDKDGVLTVSARDKATSQSKQIIIDGAAGALDKAAVDKMLAEAAAAKADDDIRRSWSQAKNDLDQMIYSSKKLMQDVGSKLSKKTRTRVEQEIKGAEGVLAVSTKPADPKLLLAVTDSLRKAMHSAAEELYKTKP
ncbi:MAG TPA: Hsp70 family protein [Kofleriaceae bacterium]|nr:Hsp70 family protein [Kofleriaceae bacterium]